MGKFKHTERTVSIYNSMIKEYREIECDSDLEKIGLEYDDYKSSDFGLFLDMLRFNGEAMTDRENVANWSKNHGCNVYLIDKQWKVQL